MDNEARIKEIDKEFKKAGFIDAIPMIMIGLSLHAKFREGGDPVFEFLKNETIVNSMLAVSVPIVLWNIIKLIKLAIERNNLEKNANL